MKKRKLANLIMAAVILVIAAAGVLTVGYIQGWFEKAEGQGAVLTDIRGIVTLARQGVAYPAQGETILRAGDEITCTPGATAVIRTGDGYLTIGEKAVIAVSDPTAFTATVTAGEVFVNTGEPVTLVFDGKQIIFADTVASLSILSGAQSIRVFAGTVESAQAGQLLDWVGGTLSVTELPMQSLNDFNIAQLRLANESKVLCFTNADLDRLAAERQAQMQARPSEPDVTEPSETQPEETLPAAAESSTAPLPSQPAATQPPATNPPTAKPTAEETKPIETVPSVTETVPPETVPPVTEAAPPETVPPVTETVPPETVPPVAETVPPETGAKLTCTLSIRCDTILNNWDKLAPAKAGFVPSDGQILNATVSFTEGETVFDVLKRACNDYGIQLEYSYTPLYGSYYVEGIHNLYEFDCGTQSGWMYKVNGWFPNYGCSGYTLSDGDQIVWCYTCNGYGADLGA